jgi:hypothetical protein
MKFVVATTKDQDYIYKDTYSKKKSESNEKGKDKLEEI